MNYWSYQIYEQINTDNSKLIAEVDGFESESEAEYFANICIHQMHAANKSIYFVRTF